jgi:hypothetical protein
MKGHVPEVVWLARPVFRKKRGSLLFTRKEYLLRFFSRVAVFDRVFCHTGGVVFTLVTGDADRETVYAFKHTFVFGCNWVRSLHPSPLLLT